MAETFARQTLANFANFGIYRESFSCKIFENSNSRKFVLQIFSTFQFAKVYPVKILLLSTKILKETLFSVDSLFFLFVTLCLERNTKEQIQELLSPLFGYSTGDSYLFNF